ncbi:unnamed protein product [Protopolystoma xenopodis]|uniref:Uncharacterized protein n=1 Tax=Protopolystoma xenopodis TaxID=117903 RepID=A0A3S5C1P3_9PLAT|nr:unnamed protein product [Protopolystoma xenopodis]
MRHTSILRTGRNTLKRFFSPHQRSSFPRNRSIGSVSITKKATLSSTSPPLPAETNEALIVRASVTRTSRPVTNLSSTPVANSTDLSCLREEAELISADNLVFILANHILSVDLVHQLSGVRRAALHSDGQTDRRMLDDSLAFATSKEVENAADSLSSQSSIPVRRLRVNEQKGSEATPITRKMFIHLSQKFRNS